MVVTKACAKCTAPATHIPRLSMFAFPGAAPHEMFFDYPVCRAHTALTPADLVTTEAWTMLVVALVGAGKIAPKRALNRVDAVPIRGHEAREFYRLVEVGRAQKFKTPDHTVN